MRLYPAPGLKVRDPRTRAFIDPVEGVEVGPNDFDLLRMIRDGDLVKAPPAPPPAPKAPPPPAPEPATQATAAEAAPETKA